MAHAFESRRARWIAIGIALATSAIIAVTAATGEANPGPLPGADTIILELEDGNNRFVYGAAEQLIAVGKSDCSVNDTYPALGDIMTIHAATYDKHGNAVDPASVGLVDDGLGVSETGKGNGQDCGRVDSLSDVLSEELTLTLGERIGGRLVSSVDFDFEAKFDAAVEIDYLLGGVVLFSETFDLSNNGSDSGPDSKFLDKYARTGPYEPDHVGTLFDGVTIRMLSGGVALEGGDTWPEPAAHRTVFNLTPALGCGESSTEGGPLLTDDPRAAFYVGPNKDGSDCAVPVSIQTENTGTGQTVFVGPPSGYTWDGVTGVVTIEWDIEDPDLEGIGRTVQIFGDDSTEVIPWCADVVDIGLASGEWFYELSDPDATYPFATGDGDICLIFQNTTTVDDGGVIFTQTTETFYIWNDPLIGRF